MNRLKTHLLKDLLNQTPPNGVYKCTDYVGLLDLDGLREIGVGFEFNEETRVLLIPLQEETKENFLKWLEKIENLPTQENHIYLNGKKILESYDGFEGGSAISSNFNIDQKYRDAGFHFEVVKD